MTSKGVVWGFFPPGGERGKSVFLLFTYKIKLCFKIFPTSRVCYLQ